MGTTAQEELKFMYPCARGKGTLFPQINLGCLVSDRRLISLCRR
jgi:hypothetical protein